MLKRGEKSVFIAVLLISLSAVIVLSVSGCRRAGMDEPSDYDYRSGTYGLTLSFPANTLTKIYENDRDARFMVEIRNRGAFPQSDEISDFYGKLWIGGYDTNILKIYPRLGSGSENGVELNANELEGKSSYNRDGGFSIVEFKIDAGELPLGTPFYKPRIIVTASYFYKTIANPMICVDPDPRSTKIKEKVCTIGDYSGSVMGSRSGGGTGSQGAPVAVTRIEEDVTSNDIMFKIYIQNSGSGLVISEGDIGTNPSEGYDRSDINKVRIDDIRAGSIPMTECRPPIASDVQLINDKGYIFCRLDKSAVGAEAYTTPLNIQLSYGYTTSIERQIEVFEELSFR
ncbi:hypothetical protein KY358_06220 [Candidatus Woesearchaeota archaeon]|nr:hypothetical protein [Candidatus Woesearchaeota archaeon]